MARFIVKGELTLSNVTFEVEAENEAAAHRAVRRGEWDDRNEDEAKLRRVSVTSITRRRPLPASEPEGA